ncbi:outer membrane MltA-interaction protein MipA [Alteromonas halophila]|uniref:Outer membrane MltA-interaction protein MipA n=1 Tax=Alteromonas halophila TaxID=516698 RepID=A0A918JK92_9ALTE|nr:outer membrane MltA-interaction protein MipA [Alteromonas halophila]
MGIGGRSNPLVDGDTIPYVLLPDIAYYGETFYFDNLETGVQFFPSSNTSIDVFVVPNAEKANFSFWHSANILIPAATLSSNGLVDKAQQEPQRISVDDVSSRRWALDAGVRWQWHNRNHHVRLMLASDISSVYNGQHGALEYRYTTSPTQHLRIAVGTKLLYKGKGLSDYYYGIHADDKPASATVYTAAGGMQIGVDISALYRINNHWRWLARVGARRLHSGMTDSPLVEDNTVYTMFAGVAYRF